MSSGCSSRSNGGGTYRHIMTDFDRESRTVATSLLCFDSLGHHVCRQSDTTTINLSLIPRLTDCGDQYVVWEQDHHCLRAYT